VSQLPLIVGPAALGLAAVLGALALGAGTPAASSGVDQIETFYGQSGPVAVKPGSTQELSPLLDRFRVFAMRVSPKRTMTKIQHNLDLAGNPTGWNTERVLAYKTLGLLGVAAFGLLIGLGHGGKVVLFVIAGAGTGFFLPNLLVHNVGLKRQEKIQKALPDAMDMITVCVEAGLGFDAAVAKVARNTKGSLASEFARVLQEMQFGKSRVDALKAMVERTTVPELRIMVSALVQASQLGIPVAAVLREQATEMRLRRRQRAEEKAQKVTVKILFPLIFCLLPALFIVVMGPGVIGLYSSLSGV
jgi:tight adherence protein C